MSLRVYDQLEQGTDEWLEARRGMLTASVVGKMLTATLKVADNDTSRGIVAGLVAERITGYVEPTHMNDDMWRGVETEPIARDKYAETTGRTVTEVGFMVRDFGGGSLGYSPDGLVGDDGLLEIKAPRQKTHLRTVISNQVPAHYMGQCQAGLLVTGRKWLDFVSYCAGMPMWTIRVLPDPKWQAALTEAVRTFEANATALADQYLSAADGMPVAERIDDPTNLGLEF